MSGDDLLNEMLTLAGAHGELGEDRPRRRPMTEAKLMLAPAGSGSLGESDALRFVLRDGFWDEQRVIGGVADSIVVVCTYMRQTLDRIRFTDDRDNPEAVKLRDGPIEAMLDLAKGIGYSLSCEVGGYAEERDYHLRRNLSVQLLALTGEVAEMKALIAASGDNVKKMRSSDFDVDNYLRAAAAFKEKADATVDKIRAGIAALAKSLVSAAT